MGRLSTQLPQKRKEIDMSAIMEMNVVTTGVEVSEASFFSFCKAAFDHMVDVMKKHNKWVPFQDSRHVELSGHDVLDPKLIVELSWVFGVEGKVDLSFENVCEEIGIDARRFREICLRKYNCECAYIDSKIGALFERNPFPVQTPLPMDMHGIVMDASTL